MTCPGSPPATPPRPRPWCSPFGGPWRREAALWPASTSAFIGLGSVGLATLRLLLSCLPHPARLSLCDVYSKQEILESLRRELIDELGYRGEVRLLASRHEVPAELYEASLIVGATNVAEILDIDRLAPGTIVVDDSAPHAFRSGGGASAVPRAGRHPRDRGGRAPGSRAAPAACLRPGRTRAVAQGRLGLAHGAEQSALHHRLRPVRPAVGQVRHLAPTIGLIDRQTALDQATPTPGTPWRRGSQPIIPGDHYTIMQRPAVERLAEILAGEIEGLGQYNAEEIQPR